MLSTGLGGGLILESRPRPILESVEALRERMEVREVPTPEAAFLEIPATLVLGGVEASEAQVDIVLADGSQLRMRGRSLDTAAIVSAFMGRR